MLILFFSFCLRKPETIIDFASVAKPLRICAKTQKCCKASVSRTLAAVELIRDSFKVLNIGSEDEEKAEVLGWFFEGAKKISGDELFQLNTDWCQDTVKSQNH